MSSKPILTVRGVERRFDKTLALQATDLDVAENDFITILGPSGCGKSTLLRIVAGLDRQTGGEVQLDGQRIEGPGADRGVVFQSYTLFPWLTVRDNVCFGLVERGLPRPQQLEIADAFLNMYLFETVCTIQVRALAGSRELVHVDPRIVAGAQAQAKQVTRGVGGGALTWPGLLRRLDRMNPGYRD